MTLQKEGDSALVILCELRYASIFARSNCCSFL